MLAYSATVTIALLRRLGLSMLVCEMVASPALLLRYELSQFV